MNLFQHSPVYRIGEYDSELHNSMIFKERLLEDFASSLLILDIAKYLEVPVVAEGVETGEQYITLKKMGCDIVQGYYFSRPVPFEKFEVFITKTI